MRDSFSAWDAEARKVSIEMKPKETAPVTDEEKKKIEKRRRDAERKRNARRLQREKADKRGVQG